MTCTVAMDDGRVGWQVVWILLQDALVPVRGRLARLGGLLSESATLVAAAELDVDTPLTVRVHKAVSETVLLVAF